MQGSGYKERQDESHRFARLDYEQISAYNQPSMRRKAGALVSLEIDILLALVAARREDVSESHGFQIAKLLQEGSRARLLTAHGTLYRALERLENMGLLESRWEDPQIAVTEGRPVRRLYRLTDAGSAAVAKNAVAPRRIRALRRRLARA